MLTPGHGGDNGGDGDEGGAEAHGQKGFELEHGVGASVPPNILST